MTKTILALIFIGLVVYVRLRKILAKDRGKVMKCASCGRTIAERPVKKVIKGKELVFCCEHCADAHIPSEDKESGEENKPSCCH